MSKKSTKEKVMRSLYWKNQGIPIKAIGEKLYAEGLMNDHTQKPLSSRRVRELLGNYNKIYSTGEQRPII